MKRILSVLIVLTMIIGLLPINVSAASDLLYNIDEYSKFPSVVRLDGAETFGFGGRTAADSSAKFQLNTVEAGKTTYNGYFDLDWGKVSDGVWDKSDFKGYLITKFSVYTDRVPTFLGLYTDGNASVSGNLNDKINLDKWNDIMVVTDRTGGTNNGKTSTYINGSVAIDWTDDKLGQSRGNGSFYYRLRFFMSGAQGSVFYMDDVSVLETDTIPEIKPTGDLSVYRFDDFADFPKFVRADTYDSLGVCGKSSSDSSVKVVVQEQSEKDVTSYFDLNWGSVTDGVWNKADFSGYLVVEFSVLPESVPTWIRLCSNGSSAIGANVAKSVKIGEWNKIVNIIDKTSGSNHGKTATYVNGEPVGTWTEDTLGDPHSATSIKTALRFLVGGDIGSVFYFDDLHVYETQNMPIIGNVITPIATGVKEFVNVKLSAEDFSGNKYGRENVNCAYVTDNDTASDAFLQKSWKANNTYSKYFVLSMDIAPNENADKLFIGTNSNNTISATSYNGIHLAKNKWNRYVMVYDIVNNISDVYINGETVFSGTMANYVVGKNDCFRIIFTGDGFEAFIDNLNVYECIDYPEISVGVYAEDCFDTEKGLHVDNKSDTISTMGDKTVASVKTLFADNVDVRIYEDDTYTHMMADDDVIENDGVVVVETEDGIMTYYTVSVYEKDTLSLYSENYNTDYNIIVNDSINVIAPVSDGGVVVTAQYGEEGELIKLQLASGTGETCINDIFTPNAVVNSTIKAFLWNDKSSIKPVSPIAEIEYTPGKTVCFLGDSITQKGKYIEEVYEYYCRDDNAKPGLRMYNCGIPGDKTLDALARIDEDCLCYNPDVTFVILGTNDMNLKYFPLDEDKFASLEAGRNSLYTTYRANMISIIERLKSAGSEVILMTPVPYDDVSDTTTQRNVGIRKCGEIVREIAEIYGLDYIDMYEGMKDLKWSDYYFADMVHPSERGHHVMAQIILKHYGCVDEIDTGDYIRNFTTANAMRYEQSYHYRFVKHIDYSSGFRGLTLAEKKAKALATIKTLTSSHDIMRYTLYYDNIETIDKMNEELIRMTIETSLKK